MHTTLAVSATAMALAISLAPATAQTTIDVPIKLKNCASCTITAWALVGNGDWNQEIRLRNGAGVLRVPSRVSDFQVEVRKGIYSAPGAAALLVMAYTGEEVGSRVSNKRSRASKSGLVCLPLSKGLVIRARVKLMKTPRKERFYVGQPSQNKYVRAWAVPTLPAVVDVYDKGPNDTRRGAASAVQVICGDKR
jgi:hypothetical protein